jgi:PIN domain nuclease of toxin-antitoxin system
VRVLLDTHAILWFMLNDPKLSQTASKLITERTNDCQVSPASHWEIALKIGAGRYRLTGDFEALWNEVFTRFGSLAIEPRHTARLISLPFHHKDPFDRLLVAQALAEQIPLVSADSSLDAYGIRRLW